MRSPAEPLTPEEAAAFYDRFGRKQDAQAFYEDAALDRLLANSALDCAHRVFEFGCGTGRLAERMLATRLPPDAEYDGADVSRTMVSLAGARLLRFGERATVRRIGGANPFEGLRKRPDRIVTTYVLDLLPPKEIASFLDCSARMLEREGRLCMAGLTFGRGPLSRVVTAGWRALFRLSPRLVGGCRPVRLLPFVSPDAWDVVYHDVVEAWGIPSEVLVAVKTVE